MAPALVVCIICDSYTECVGLTCLCPNSNVEANLIVICPCLPSLRQFLRHHFPEWLGESSSHARAYLGHPSTSASRSRFKSGTSRAADEIALTDNGESTHSRTRIVKEIEWNVTEERMDEDSDDQAKKNQAKQSYGYDG